MKIIAAVALVGTQLAAAVPPAFAAEIQHEAGAATGAFGGLRLRVPLDGRRGRVAPQLGLAVAPTVHMMGEGGAVRMRIGEGLEYGFAARSRSPALSIAGRRLAAAQDDDQDDRGGIDTGEAILIGAGVIVLVLAAGTIWFVNELNESSE